MKKVVYVKTPINSIALRIRILFFTLGSFLLLQSCKKTPTFSDDNPYDIYSDSYIPSSPENFIVKINNADSVLLSWNISHFNEYETESSFLVEVIIDNEIQEEITITDFTDKLMLEYKLIPDQVYQFSVTTIFNGKKSEPTFSTILDLIYSEITNIWVYQESSNSISVYWKQSDAFSFIQEVYLKNKLSGESEFYVLEPDENNRFDINFSELNTSSNYELGISKVLNGVKSPISIYNLLFSNEINLITTLSIDKTDEGISFLNPIAVPSTNYIIATNTAGSTIYVINRISKKIENTIITPLNDISNIVTRPDSTFYFYNEGTIYKGEINSDHYERLLDTSNNNTSIPLFGLGGFEYEFIYYSENGKVNFHDINSGFSSFEIQGNVTNLCISYMEDQIIAIKDNILEYYTFPEIELRHTFTASEETYFNSCEFSESLNKIFVTGYNSETSTNFFGKLNKNKILSNFTIINKQTGFGNLYFFSSKDQILVSTFDPESGEINNSPFYVYDVESETLTTTSTTYNGLNAPSYSLYDNGYLLYSTAGNPSGVIEEIFIGDGWVLVNE